jgi:hypothetical protein
VLELGAFDVEERQPLVQPVGDPPRVQPEEAHDGGQQRQAHDRRVDQDRHREADAELLDDHEVRQRERHEDGHHDRRGPGDHLGRLLDAELDRRVVALGAHELLPHAREQEDLVVDRERERDREDPRD